jgi:hypothetical protein
MRLKAADLARLLIARATVVACLIHGELWLTDLGLGSPCSALRSRWAAC